MTLRELVTSLRDLLDVKGGQGLDWTEEGSQSRLRWSNDELVRFINEAYRETAKRTLTIMDVVEIEVNNTDYLYDLPSNLLSIRRAKLNLGRFTLMEVSWKDVDALDSTWESRTGEPTDYMTDWIRGSLRLHPKPVTADTLTLNIYRYPTDLLTLDRWEQDTPELPEEYHYPLIYWAAHLAYLKDEPNTLDPDRAQYYDAKITNEVGPPTDAYSVERKKRAKRQLSYGGITKNVRHRNRNSYGTENA